MLDEWESYLTIRKKGIFFIAFLLLSFLLLLPVTTYASPISNRLSGQDCFQTAKAIAEQFNAGTVQDVIITSGNNFPDALSASVLAKKLNAPILLVASNVQDSDEAFDYISKHLSKTGTVHIIGGTGIISSKFETKLNQMGYPSASIDRIGGNDRYDTDVLIGQKLDVAKNTPVVIASGETFPDALSISSVASSKGWPILLVGKQYLAQGVKDFIVKDQPSQVYIVGGTGVISKDVSSQVQALVPETPVTILAGQDLFDTNASIIQTFVPSPKNIYVATGLGFADALAGSVLAAKTGDPIILVNPKIASLSPTIVTYLSKLDDAKDIAQITSFGGTAVVPEAHMTKAKSILHDAEGNVILSVGVSLNKSVTTLNIGESDTLTATITPTNATNKNVSWISSNTEVATIDQNGKVLGVSVGTAVITVTTLDGGKTASCTITVNSPEVIVTGVDIDKSVTTLNEGESDTLTATIAPTNATNKNVSWISSNTEVATVDQSGKVLGVSVGTAVITATTVDGSKTASCTIYVNTPGEIVAVTGVSLEYSFLTINKGESDTLTATLAPANATNRNLSWMSSDTTVVTVDQNGKVVGVSAGTAAITVTALGGNTTTASCTIIVNPSTIIDQDTDPTGKLSGKLIVVDPGHGGPDTGAIGATGTYEKNNTLAVGLDLAESLRSAGARVVLTRSTDISPAVGTYSELSDLQARTNIANSLNADLFISLHNNAASSSVAVGTETYYSSDSLRAAQSKVLARSIQSELIEETGLYDRGVKDAAFYVIKYTKMPSVLVEAAFISNPTEETLLGSTDFRQKVAGSILKGVLDFWS